MVVCVCAYCVFAQVDQVLASTAFTYCTHIHTLIYMFICVFCHLYARFPQSKHFTLCMFSGLILAYLVFPVAPPTCSALTFVLQQPALIFNQYGIHTPIILVLARVPAAAFRVGQKSSGA